MSFDPDIIELQAERTPEGRGYYRLIAAVLHRGIVDFAADRMKKDKAEFHSSQIYFWFWSDDRRPYGLVWLCSVLDYDIAQVRDRTLSKSRGIAALEKRGKKKTCME